ncbi:hypothetical protein CW747_14345 [Staphylococcus shinii]|nr:hypothetical protein CW747_14345 [Staphylococcus shinii]
MRFSELVLYQKIAFLIGMLGALLLAFCLISNYFNLIQIAIDASLIKILRLVIVFSLTVFFYRINKIFTVFMFIILINVFFL